MTEETFIRELQRRAEHVNGVPLSIEDVRGTARSIRRRRRAATAAAAAVVAAVLVVPTLLSVHGGGTVEPAPAPRAAHTAVLHDGVVTLPGGRTVPLDVDNENVVDFGVLTDGRIVVGLQHPFALRVYAPDGSRWQQYPAQANVFTMSAADDAVAWVTDDFSIEVMSSGQAEPTTLPGIPMAGEAVGSIDAVLDPEHLLVGDFSTTTGEVSPRGYEDLSTSEPLRVNDVAPDGSLWAVDFPPRSGEQFGCAGLYDPQKQAVVARTCETSRLRFAPDGQHLLGTRGDNNMYGDVVVVDRHLDQVFRSRLVDSVVSRVAWADAEHVFVATTGLSGEDWQLVRERVVPPLGDGDPDVVDGPAAGGNPESVAEYLFSD